LQDRINDMGDGIVSYFEACELPGLHCMEFSELGIGLETTGIGIVSRFPGLMAYRHRSYWDSVDESVILTGVYTSSNLTVSINNTRV